MRSLSHRFRAVVSAHLAACLILTQMVGSVFLLSFPTAYLGCGYLSRHLVHFTFWQQEFVEGQVHYCKRLDSLFIGGMLLQSIDDDLRLVHSGGS